MYYRRTMSFLDVFKYEHTIKRFAVDSLAHTAFYGLIGAGIAIALGIEPEVYITMSIVGTAIQLLSGGLFGRFLDFVRKIAKA